MSKNKLDIIEKRLKIKKIPEYEIFFIKKDVSNKLHYRIMTAISNYQRHET